ncbi:TRAP transporter small permease [Penaeicola halotolerans]|uniref:TRAP transporter small permease n=1 Tax=Penaeicola halotolerans TaxID=2793196 RepID=UPI001CF8FD82|nr:TRAP transporter small permease [Penaeicola halotolerans]
MKTSIDKVVAVLLIILMGLMVLNVTWQVSSRYIFQNPSAFTDELSRYMLIWLGMLGAAYVAGQGKHLAIDLLLSKMSAPNQLKLQMIICALVMIFALVTMVYGGANLVYITYTLSQKSATLQVPLAYVYAIIPLSGLLTVYYQLEAIFQRIKLIK